MKYLYILLTIITLMTNAMSEVTILESATPTATAVWDANTDGVTTGYKLFIGNSPNNYSNEFSTLETTFKFPPLNYNTIYYISVLAHDKNGIKSPPSSEVSFKIIKPIIRKYAVISITRDSGKTWTKVGEVVIPPPIVVGQLYKYTATTTKIIPIKKYVTVSTSKDRRQTWVILSKMLVPEPYVAGQKYKMNIVNK